MKQPAAFGWAQLNYTVGDFNGNAKKIENAYEKMADSSDWVVFSELSLCGYYPQDLIERHDFMKKQAEALLRVQAMTVGKRAWVVVGGVQPNHTGVGKPWFNGLWVVGDGMIQGAYQKRLLPTYNIFDERRHFEPGTSTLVVERAGMRVGFVICEDLWNVDGKEYRDDPVKDTVSRGIDLLIGLNASPSNIGKHKQRIELMRSLCQKHDVPLMYVNQVGANDELVFDGASFCLGKSGFVHMVAKSCEEDMGIMEFSPRVGWMSTKVITAITDVEMMRKHAVLGLKDYLQKQKFGKVVVGCSGGIDSALTLALAVDALGAENVTAITMPSEYSSEGSVSDSEVLCNNLGVKLLYRSIKTEVDEAIKQFKASFGDVPSTLTEENIQARIRGRILMEYSNHYGAIVLSTGNKSEMSVGYATLYGDMNGGLNLIGDMYKMEVYAVSSYVNERNGSVLIPEDIISKPPSAELRPGQRDDDTLPPYPVLDAILRAYVEPNFLSSEQKWEDHQLLKDTPMEVVNKVLLMVDKAEFKRRQAPPIIRMHGKSFGQGRQLPIVHSLVPVL